MLFKKFVLLLLFSQATFSLNALRSIKSHAPWDHKITSYDDCVPVTSIAEPSVTTKPRTFTSSAVSRKLSSSSLEPTKYQPNRASLTAVSSGTSARNASHSIIASQVVSPGRNGTPGCAYILAADMGPNPACAQDHCDCDGTIAPLISSLASGTWTTNCDYTVLPATSSCPAPVITVGVDPQRPPPVTILGTVHVQGVCTATVGGGETCGYKTYTSVTTIRS